MPEQIEQQFIMEFSRHNRRIYAYILSLVGDPLQAEDILQDCNIVLWKKFSQFELGSSFFSWACRIAYYEVLMWRRQQKKQGYAVLDEDILDRISLLQAKKLDSHFDEQRLALHSCLKKLGAFETTLIQQRYFYRTKLDEVSRQCGKSVTSLKQSLLRIRLALKRCIKNEVSER